ncbi:MAG: tRNA uridine-5-carboxymethylaminomethyl(34) synthesis GTPase MnmE [Alphaproteobacteria bacterium]|nr:tRNA uridine-5-carboxymethylaminomethyl(34) synthesis GTPase MnmE [Alphaproteobacteria bacterium]MBO6863664.1 tRNA uridine-5-carboxymethylaminomethyl(34) synthesis GTPase MnmE [Alphaproteobacteria bacterium]
MTDTIFALGSGPAPAGVAVIRVSGPAAAEAVCALAGLSALPEARRAVFRPLRHPASGEVLDHGLVLWLPGPGTFTGEDVAEFQGHGGVASINALLNALSDLEGCRQAEAGEFTRRAFANGRMDLTEVEGLADLIAAETEAQRRLALRLAAGEGRDRYQDWTDRLVRVLAYLEAAVDFPEDDLPESMLERNEIEIRALLNEWAQDIELGALSSGIRDGVRVAIVGAPNVGKSSLLNRLAGREAAIVSDIAGTTRDVVEVRMDLGGYLVTLADTAGLRDTRDQIEEEGVRRALRTAESADLVLFLSDDSADFDTPPHDRVQRAKGDVISVLTKADLSSHGNHPGNTVIPVSSKTGAGIGDLLRTLETACRDRLAVSAGAVAVRARHRDALSRAAEALERALSQPEAALAGEDIRLALSEMGRITGRVDVEAVLDVLFGEFCIGK